MGREPWNKLKPKKFVLLDRCSKLCSLNPSQWPVEQAHLVHSWYEAGLNDPAIVAECDKLGHHVSAGAVGRHRANHLQVAGDEPQAPTGTLDKVNHIEFLEQLVARAATSVGVSTRVSPEMGIRAVEMLYKLTQGSAMDNFLTEVTRVMAQGDEQDDDYLDPLELAEAKRTAEEGAQSEVVGE